MADDPEKKVSARFYRNANGTEPVRDWLQARKKEVRSNLPRNRISRVLFCVSEGYMVLLHAFIKKSRTTPQADLDLARSRQQEVER